MNKLIRKSNIIISMLIGSCVLACCSFIYSILFPDSILSDIVIMLALFCAALSGIVATLLTQQLLRSKNWRFILWGLCIFLLGFVLKGFKPPLLKEIFHVTGALLFITALAHFIYTSRYDLSAQRWIWFTPVILLGCLFKMMHWPGANIMIFASLLLIALLDLRYLLVTSFISRKQQYKILLQVVSCIGITILYFRYIRYDFFIIAYIITWFVLIHIIFEEEASN